MKSLLRTVGLLSVLAVLAGAGSGDSQHGPGHGRGDNGKFRQSRSNNGAYLTTIAGYCSGTGISQVNETGLSITASVLLPDDSKRLFIARSLKIDGPYFSGTGSIGSEDIDVAGRLDAARISRLIGTYSSKAGHSGRIIATLPGDTPDSRWRDTGPVPGH